MTYIHQFDIKWLDRGHPPRQQPNPAYPDGCHVDITETARRNNAVKLTQPSLSADEEQSCLVPLTYPTGRENVGTWIIECRLCGNRTAVTAASRPDDPRSVRLPCKGGKVVR